jgi:hypothetical protein
MSQKCGPSSPAALIAVDNGDTRAAFCQLHNSLGGGYDPQGGTEVVLIPLPDAAPIPDPALDP